MRFVDTLRSLLRRWYIVLTGVAVTVALAFLAYGVIPVTYQAEGRVLLMPPQRTVPPNGNPYMFLGGMSQALDVLVAKAGAEDVVKPIMDASPGSTYTVATDPTTSAPVVLITVTAKDARSAMTVLSRAMATIGNSLQAMQDQESLAEPLRIKTASLVVDPKPTKDQKNRLTMTVVSTGAGLVGTVILTGFIDGWLMQRRSRRSHRAATESAASARSEDGGKSDVDARRSEQRKHEAAAVS